MAADFQVTIVWPEMIGVVDDPGRQPQNLAFQRLKKNQSILRCPQMRHCIIGVEVNVGHESELGTMNKTALHLTILLLRAGNRFPIYVVKLLITKYLIIKHQFSGQLC
jgi:hypothetical protein